MFMNTYRRITHRIIPFILLFRHPQPMESKTGSEAVESWEAAQLAALPQSPKSRLLLLLQVSEMRAMFLTFILSLAVYAMCFYGPRLQSHPWHIFIFIGFSICFVRYVASGGSACDARLFKHRVVAIVTGSNSGIGLATATALLRHGITVVFAVRDVEKMKKMVPKIAKDLDILDPSLLDDYIHILPLDLTSASSIQNFVTEFANLRLPCHILVNNAGALRSRYGVQPAPCVTRELEKFFEGDAKSGRPRILAPPVEGALVEDSFACNFLGHFLLTLLLLPMLDKCSARVINLTSLIHISVTDKTKIEEMNMTDVRTWDGPTAYARAKLCVIWFTRALQRRFDELGGGAQAFAVHPGTVWSPFHMPFYRDSPCGIFMLFPLLMSPLAWLCMKSTEEGCQTTIQCALGRNLSPGQHYAECGISACSPLAQDDEKGEAMWRYCLSLLGLTEEVVTRGKRRDDDVDDDEDEDEDETEKENERLKEQVEIALQQALLQKQVNRQQKQPARKTRT